MDLDNVTDMTQTGVEIDCGQEAWEGQEVREELSEIRAHGKDIIRRYLHLVYGEDGLVFVDSPDAKRHSSHFLMEFLAGHSDKHITVLVLGGLESTAAPGTGSCSVNIASKF